MGFPLVPGWPTESKFEKIVRAHTEVSRREAKQFLSGQYLGEEAPEQLESDVFADRLLDQAEHWGAYGVMVMSRRDEDTCTPCLKQDGKQHTIEEARNQAPFPHGNCANEECRCSYVPILNEETYTRVEGDEPDLPNHLDV
jgi:hypothetical protein